MREYQTEQDKIQEAGGKGNLKRVRCNRCGKELKVEQGYLKEGCFHADTVFGYFSRKDGIRHRFDLCENCYDEWTAQFAVPVEINEETELL